MRKTNCSGPPDTSRFFNLKKTGLQESYIDKVKTTEKQTGNYVSMNLAFLRVLPGSLLVLFL